MHCAKNIMWYHFNLIFLILGWAPTRRLRDVIWGLNSLFTDLLNFDDPLNIAAAEHYQRDKDAFRLKTKQWVVKYAKRWNSKWKNPENYPETLEIPGILSGYEQYLCFCHLYTMSWFIKLSQSSTLKLFFLWQKKSKYDNNWNKDLNSGFRWWNLT